MGRKTVYKAAYDDEYWKSENWYKRIPEVSHEHAQKAAEAAVERWEKDKLKNNRAYVRKHREKKDSAKEHAEREGRKPITVYLNDADLKRLDERIKELNQTPDELSRSYYIGLLLSLN